MNRFNEQEVDPIVQKVLGDLEDKYRKQKTEKLESLKKLQETPRTELIEIRNINESMNQKIVKQPDDSYGYLTPASKLGVIIGKNGDNLRFIAEQSNTKITVCPYNDPIKTHLRMISIIGDFEDAQRAVELIETSIKTFQYHLVGSFSNPGSIFQSNHIVVDIPNSIVGTLLGKQSETLLKVHSKYGVQMALLKDEEIDKGCNTRPLLISGRNKYIAKNEIESLIERAKLSTVNFLERNFVNEKIERRYYLDLKLLKEFSNNFKLAMERKYNLIITVKYETMTCNDFSNTGLNYVSIRGNAKEIEMSEKEINARLKQKDIQLKQV